MKLKLKIKHEIESWYWNLKLKLEIESWNWVLKLNPEIETWNLKLTQEVETWNWNLNLELEFGTWIWNLKLKLEIETWFFGAYSFSLSTLVLEVNFYLSIFNSAQFGTPFNFFGPCWGCRAEILFENCFRAWSYRITTSD